jgi:hypothetical protein
MLNKFHYSHIGIRSYKKVECDLPSKYFMDEQIESSTYPIYNFISHLNTQYNHNVPDGTYSHYEDDHLCVSISYKNNLIHGYMWYRDYNMKVHVDEYKYNKLVESRIFNGCDLISITKYNDDGVSKL